MINRKSPLKRGKPMARGKGFQRPTFERAPCVLTAAPDGLAARVRTGPAALRADPKPAQHVEHKGYRMLVASMPCWLCGRPGRSQFAHENQGKGAGLKTDDRTGGPLCADEPGRIGCHMLLDQSGRLPRETVRALLRQMGADTRDEVLASGMWPASLPQWVEPVEAIPPVDALKLLAYRTMATVLIAAGCASAAAAPVCDWNNPGSNPTTVDAAAVIDQMAMFTDEERTELKRMVKGGYNGRPVVYDGREIDDGSLTPLGMSFGAGRLCLGKIQTDRWSPGRQERGWAFEHGRAAVVIWTSCSNVTPAINERALQPVDEEAVKAARQAALRARLLPQLFVPPAPTPPAGAQGPSAQGGGSASTVRAVPEPASLWLGLVALAAALWFKRGGRR